MPFKEHPLFLPPSNMDAKIWRYMDLSKFLSVLDKSSLYFTRLDQLSKFDSFEGYYTNINVSLEKVKFEDIPDNFLKAVNVKSEKDFTTLKELNKFIMHLTKRYREVVFVNCWHAKDYESAAMWKLYMNNNEGVAIQSTYEKLIESLKNYKDFSVHIGMLNYIDYGKEAIPMNNAVSPFLYKRKSFEHEQELRALIWTLDDIQNFVSNPDVNKFKDVSGIYVPVNLDTLIDQIYVAPDSPEWFIEIVSSILKKYGINHKPNQSDLSAAPLY